MKKLSKILTTAVLMMVLCFNCMVNVEAQQQFSNASTNLVSTNKATVKAKWVKTSKGYKYLNTNNTYSKNKFQTISGKKYHFDANGIMATNWKKISNKWYYFGTDGAMRTGWQKISGYSYYFNASGVMQANKWISKKYVGYDGKYVEGVSGTKGTSGRLAMPSVGFSIPLYGASSSNFAQLQKIVDNKNSALLSEIMGSQYIADHAAQGFKVMKNSKAGQYAYIIDTKGVVHTYQFVSKATGQNVGNGIVLTSGSSKGKYADEVNGQDLFMYCCNDSTGKSVTVTFWKLVK